MAIISSKDFSAPDTTRIRNMVAGRMGVPAPATQQQTSDYITRLLKRDTKDWEDSVARAAINNTEPD